MTSLFPELEETAPLSEGWTILVQVVHVMKLFSNFRRLGMHHTQVIMTIQIIVATTEGGA